jgi:phosphonate transport system substrate-binding protein
LHQPVEIVQRSTYAEINDLIKSRYVDLAFVCSLAYVKGEEDFGMELLVAPEVHGEIVYYSYIIAPASSSIESLEDFKGTHFAFTDPLSNTGRLAPTYMIHQLGESIDNFFEHYIFTYSHDKSIKAVADNIVDGAAVDSLVYHYIISKEPAMANKLKIVHKSPPYGIPPVVVHPALDQEVKARLRSIFINLHTDEVGGEILNNLLIDRFVLYDDSAYDTIRNMAHKLGL